MGTDSSSGGSTDDDGDGGKKKRKKRKKEKVEEELPRRKKRSFRLNLKKVKKQRAAEQELDRSTLLLGDRAFTGQSTGRMNHEIIRILTELPLILKREDKEKAAKSKQNESTKQNEANKEKRTGTQKPPFLKKTILRQLLALGMKNLLHGASSTDCYTWYHT